MTEGMEKIRKMIEDEFYAFNLRNIGIPEMANTLHSYLDC